MRVAVTGAQGFVGMNVVRKLAIGSHDVLAVGRNELDVWVRAFLSDIEYRVAWRRADLRQRGALAHSLATDAVDVLIHAAVITATTSDVERGESLDIVAVNVGGTMEALDAARLHRCRRFVYVSSPSAIGQVDATGPLREDVVTNPDTLYGITKRASEQLVERYGTIHDLSTVSARISQPYGPGERATPSRLRTSPIYEWVQAARRGAPLVTGPRDAARDWTYVDETARGLVMLGTAPKVAHPLYHLGVGKQASVGEVLDILRAAYPDLTWDDRPDAPGLNPNIAGPVRRSPLSSDRLTTEFGWKPSIDIEEGMRRYLSWIERSSSAS
jgi:nucleoside-diphosphate-sugar epimerase